MIWVLHSQETPRVLLFLKKLFSIANPQPLIFPSTDNNKTNN